MTPIDKLAAVIEARTPGPWRLLDKDGRDVWAKSSSIAMTDCSCCDGINHKANAAAIAALGSCADELLAVVRAAENLRENWTFKSDLFLALAALEARIAETIP